MKLTKPQREIGDNTSRFRVAVCGRRFGKTFLAIRELARFSVEPNKLSWYIAPTRSQGKGIVWDELKARLGELRWIAKTNESELTITLVNGSEIAIKSADSYDRMRGFSVSGIAIFDEFADMSPDVWTAVRPTLSDKHGHALFIGTPKDGRASWAYDIYTNGINSLDDWQSFSFTTLEGGNVPTEEIEAARRDMDERLFKQEYEATWVDSSGQVYYAFDRETNCQEAPYLNTEIVYVGADFNVSPICASIAVKQGEDLYVIDEVVLYSSNTDELVEEIQNRYPKSKVIAFPDPAGAARKTSSNGKTDHTIMSNAGFVVKAPRKHTPVRDRINAVNARLRSASGENHLFISKKCKYTIQCLERQTYKEGSNTIPDKGEFDHMNDALGYMVDFLYPIRKDYGEIEQPARWGHSIG